MKKITRRSFIKKSTAAGIAAANVTVFSGLINASQGGGSGYYSGIFHKHKCDGNPGQIVGMGGLPLWGKHQDNNGVIWYFDQWKCKCVKNNHNMGIHYKTKQAAHPGAGVVVEGGFQNLPPKHTAAGHK